MSTTRVLTLRAMALVLLPAAAIVAFGRPAGAASTCGEPPKSGDVPLRAGLTAVPSSVTVDLGNTNGGERQVVFDVTADNTCTLPTAVPVAFGVFAGQFHDLSVDKALTGTATVDGSLVRVVVTAHRDSISAGKYTGTVRVGNGSMGFTTAQLTVTRQAPLLWVPLLFGLFALVGGILLAGFRRLVEPGAQLAPKAGAARAVSRARLARARADGTKVNAGQVLLGSIWRAALAALTPIETAIRYLAGAARRIFTAGNIWAVLVGIGAAITAFVATYVNDVSWSATIPSVVGLVSKVGGAALAASFAAWQPTRQAQ